jgi:1-phosphatidylinositol phosphodiesterase
MTKDMQKMSMDRGELLVAADLTGRRAGQAQDLSGQKRLIRRNGTSSALLRLAVTVAFMLLLGCGSSSEETTLTLGGGVATSDWMKPIPDQTPISLLSIPGTHDSGTYTQDQTAGAGFVKTQMWSISDQLSKLGIRFLDIRCRLIGNGFAIHHDLVFLGLSFQDIIDQCRSFLLAHPSETILMAVGHEYIDEGSTLSFHQVFLNYYNANKYLDDAHTRELWYLGTTIPTLGQSRGKIVLMRSFDLDSGTAEIGMHTVTDGGNSAYSYKRFSTNPDQTVYVESLWTPDVDAWTNAFDVKWKAIEDNIGRAKGDASPDHLYMTWTSATMSIPIVHWHTPLDFAQHINGRLKTFPPNSGKMGIVIMDYPGDEAFFIINTNAGG